MINFALFFYFNELMSYWCLCVNKMMQPCTQTNLSILNFILLQLQLPYQSVQWLAMVGMTGCVPVPFNTVSKMILLCFKVWQLVYIDGTCLVYSLSSHIPFMMGLAVIPLLMKPEVSVPLIQYIWYQNSSYEVEVVLSYFYLPLTLMLYFSSLY